MVETNESKKLKTLSVRLEPEFHKNLKLYTVEKGLTIQEYLINLIIKDWEKHEKEID